MDKAIRAVAVIGMSLSTLVGIWHFFVPLMFRWYDYLPMQYENLIVGIDYTNYCFSLLLTGLSILLIVLRERLWARDTGILVMFGFLAFVWLNRVLLGVFHPWPTEPIPWAAYGQFMGAVAIFILLLIPFVYLIRKNERPKP